MLAATPTSSSSSSPDATPGIYTVGTLKYTKRSMAVLFGWLLWGDFAFTFFEQIFGRFMPLYLKDLNASNTLIGITTGSIAGLVNVFFLPNISQWSDRLRSKLGRRIPFLLVVTPLTIMSLLGIGFAPEIGTWVHDHVTASIAPTITTTTTLLTLLCVFAISFHFFNMILVNAYNWLLRDVVPQVFMARFLSWFRVVGTVATVAFLWYVFPTMLTHRKETFVAISVFYFIAFMLMCWQVKEGEYPAPEPHAEGSNLLKRYGAYFHDCLALPIYRNYFLVTVLVILATWCAGSFLSLYAKHTLGLSMDEMGQIWTYSAILSAFAFAPAGWLCDRFSPIKVSLTSLVVMLAGYILAYFLVDNKSSWLIYSLAMALPGVTWGLGSLALTMQLFPDRVFGQFSAGLNVFGCGGVIGGNYLIGWLMDWTNSHYQYVFLWSAFFYALSILPMYLVYRDWKKFGGPKNYVAPIPAHMLED